LVGHPGFSDIRSRQQYSMPGHSFNSAHTQIQSMLKDKRTSLNASSPVIPCAPRLRRLNASCHLVATCVRTASEAITPQSVNRQVVFDVDSRDSGATENATENEQEPEPWTNFMSRALLLRHVHKDLQRCSTRRRFPAVALS